MIGIAARLRKLTRYLFLAFLLFLLGISALLWYVTTDSFQEMVRARLVASLERSTGGRVEIGRFHVVPLRFQMEVHDLTIHGREPTGEAPLVHVDSMVALVNFSSVLGAKISFHSLTLEHPVVHIIFYPDGSTNQPGPTPGKAGDFEQLLALSIDRLQVHGGELLWQDQRLLLQGDSNDLSAALDYSFLHRRYSGRLAVGKAETRFDGYRPFAWSGEMNFSVGRSSIDVKSLSLSSEHSRLQASGSVANLRNPVFKGTYDLKLDLLQAGAVARLPHLRAGTLDAKGSGSWSGQNFSADGEFDVRELAWQDTTYSFQNLSTTGKFAITPQSVSISQVQGRFLQGSFTSEAEIAGWRSSPKGARKKDEQRGNLKVKFQDVSLFELMAGLGPQLRPIRDLKLAGNASGNAEVHWKESIRQAEISANADVSRPRHVLPGQLPLAASVRGSYDLRSGTLQIANFSASTPSTQMQASGGLSSSSRLRISFASNDVAEWRPFAAAIFPEGLPIVVNGRASFAGYAAGSAPNLTLAGTLLVEDFDSMLSVKGRPRQTVHWDTFSADVQAASNSFSVRNAVLRAGNAVWRLDGNLGLTAWRATPESPVHARVEVQNADAAQLSTLVGYELQGQLGARMEISGTPARPQGRGSVNVLHGAVEGHQFDSVAAVVVLGPEQASFKELRLSRGESEVSGSGTYDWARGAIQANLSGRNFSLAEFSPVQRSKIQIGGTANFSAEASGRTGAPEIQAHIELRDVTLNGELAGNYSLNAVTHGADLSLTGKSDFKNAELLIKGNVRLRELWPAHIDFHFTRLDADSFLETYLHGHVTGHSAVAGDLALAGPLRDPRRLRLIGNLTDFYAEIEKVKLHNDGPIRFALSDQAFKIEGLHLAGDNTDFSGSGSAQLNGDRALDFQGRGRLGLQLIEVYDPDLTGSGSVSGEARLTGNWDAPVLKGRLQVENGSIADVNLPSALSEINGTLLFNQNQLTIEKLTARTGGGTVELAGHAEFVGRQFNFDVTANADSVRLRYPPGVSSTANAALRWNGSSSGSLLSGDITVTKVGVTPGFDFGAYLERTVQQSSLPQTDPVLNKIRLDLHVVTTPELQMQTSVLRLRGDADLRVRGNAAKPVLLGRADIFEGEAYFNGTKYRLERGGVTFNNPAVTTAFLDIEATTHVRDYDITLSMSGPAANPKVNYRSEPPLPTADIITLLAFGQTPETSAQLQQSNQSAFSQQASSAMLTAALNATLNNRTQRLFGNSRIKIDPQGLETVTSPTQSGPAVTIEQQVKDNLTLSYTTNVVQTSQQIIRAEYNVTRNVSIVAIRDQNGVVSFDVKIRRRKR
ncbi:MAG TPA: translocation/assembly module TamB domain-containing protein [Terriglobales bacterium]|nr:translocation/assembly module TamB domain-containing protein [Terriglobales bacterium]